MTLPRSNVRSDRRGRPSFCLCPRHSAGAHFTGGFSSRCADGGTGRHFRPNRGGNHAGARAARGAASPACPECHLGPHGNIFVAAVAGAVGWWWTQRAIFFLVPVFAAASTAAVMSIPGRNIDHRRARAGDFASGKPSGFSRLITSNRGLLALGLIVASFHFASGAMLPLAGQKLALHYPGLETALTSSLILTVQLITIPVAAVVGKTAKAGW